MGKKIFLIDVMPLLFKYHYRYLHNPFITKKGQNVSAIYGVINFLFEVLEKEEPDYIMIACDCKEPTFRHKLYKEYKGTRKEKPEELVQQIEIIKDVIDEINISFVKIPGYEADDIVGTIAKKSEAMGLKVFCVTIDKDYMQLISENIKVYRPTNFGDEIEIFSEAEVIDKFGVKVNQLLDYFALMGDDSDNIPGVPGVGEKTARSLLKEFNSLDNIYKNIDKIGKKGLVQKLQSGKDLAFLSKTLVTIDTNVPVKENIDSFKVKKDTVQNIKNYITKLLNK